MRDYMRDERNPYGSRGGYVSGSRPRRDRNYDNPDYYGGNRGEYYDRYDPAEDYGYEPERERGYDERSRQYRGYYGDSPFYMEEVDYPYDMRRGRDYRSSSRGGGRGMGRGDRRMHDYDSRQHA